MPEPNQIPQWDPIAEYRKVYQDPRSDAEIANKLRDPNNFRKAFPDFDYSGADANARIQQKMGDYYSQRFAPKVSPQAPQGQSLSWDKIVGTYYPEALAAANKFLKTPIGGQSFSEGIKGTALDVPAGSGKPTHELGSLVLKDAAGLADFIRTPEGIANATLTAATGGASAPFQAATYAATMGKDATDASKEAVKNPTPQNVQTALNSWAMTALTGAGALHEGVEVAQNKYGTGAFKSVLPTGPVRALPGAYSEAPAPTLEGQQSLPMAPPSGTQLSKQADLQASLAQSLGEAGNTKMSMEQLIKAGNQWVNTELATKGQLSEAGKRIQANLMQLDAISDPNSVAKQGQLNFNKPIVNNPITERPTGTANDRPQVTYKPSEKAASMSAPRNVVPEAEPFHWQEDNARMRAILDNPNASPADRQFANNRIAENAQLEATISPTSQGPSLTGEGKPEVPPLVAPSPSPAEITATQEKIVPAGLPEMGMTADEQSKANAAVIKNDMMMEASSPAPSDPIADRIKDAGLVEERSRMSLVGSDPIVNLAHPDHIGGSFNLLGSKILDMTPNELKFKAANKLDELANGYEKDPASPVLNKDGRFDPERLRTTANKLRSEAGPVEPIASEVQPKEVVSPVPQKPLRVEPIRPSEQRIPDKVEGSRLEETKDPVTHLYNHIQTLDSLIKQAHAAKEEGIRIRLENAKTGLYKTLGQINDKFGPKDLRLMAQYFFDKSKDQDAQAEGIRAGNALDEQNAPVRDAAAEINKARYGTDTYTNDEGESVPVTTEPNTRWASRDLLAQLTGKERVEGRHIEDLVPRNAPEGMKRSKMSPAEQEEFDKFQKSEIVRFQKLANDIKRDIDIAKATGSDILAGDVVDKLKELDELSDQIGRPSVKTANVGNREILPPKVGKHGEILPDQSFTWTKKAADLALNRNNRDIPTREEFEKEADRLSERSKAYTQLGKNLDSKARAKEVKAEMLVTQGGYVGEMKRGATLEPSKDVVPNDDAVMRRLEDARLNGWDVTDTKPSGSRGWLSGDGKKFISIPNNIEHDSAAWRLLGRREGAEGGDSQQAFLKAGWIRKVNNTSYEAGRFTPDNISAIEMDMIRSGAHGNDVYLEQQDKFGRTQSYGINHGWVDLAPAFAKELRAQRLQAGRAGGAAVMGRLAAGSVGAAAGAHFGSALGPAGTLGGGLIGGFAGFVSPELFGKPAYKFASNIAWPAMNQMGKSLQQYFTPPPIKAALPEMQQILEDQRKAADGIRPQMMDRLRQMPGDFFLHFADRFALISDKPGKVQNLLMSMAGDSRGAAFRDAKGKLSIDDSPFVQAHLAMGVANGHAAMLQLAFKNIQDAAVSKFGPDHLTNLREYLNLKQYMRVNEVMQEREFDLQMRIQNAQTKLQNPTLGPLEEAGLHADVKQGQIELGKLQKRAAAGEFTPNGFNANKIAQNLQMLEQKVGPARWQDIDALAQRVWAQTRLVTDALHTAGIMGDAAYKQAINRGNEYIPMYRIMTDLAENNRALAGRTSPMYLMHQEVIKSLNGSERTNIDPFIAAAKFGQASYREIARNEVAKSYVESGKVSKDIADMFEKVPAGQKAKAGHAVIGLYEGGKQNFFETPDYVAQALEGSPIAAKTMLSAAMKWTAHVFKAGATGLNLGFSIPNALAHFSRAAAMSDAGLKVGLETPKDAVKLVGSWLNILKEIPKNDPDFGNYLQSGAAFSVMQRVIDPEHFIGFENLGWKKRIAMGRIMDYVQDFNAGIEDATKLNTFKRARAAGMSEKSAAWETMNYGGAPNFSKMGKSMPEINIASMFFNAHLQYLMSDLKRIAERPQRIVPIFAAVSAMSAALAMHNWGQKDEKGDYLMRKVRPYDRDNYYVVLTGRQIRDVGTGGLKPEYYRIRKPDFAKFFLNPIENTVSKMIGLDDRSGSQLGLDAISSWLPGQYQLDQQHLGKSATTGLVSSLNPALRIPIEQATNQTSIGPIVPAREQNVEPQYQYGPTTSPTAIAMGQGGAKGAAAGAGWGGTYGELVGGHAGAVAGAAVGGAIGAVGGSPRRMDHLIHSIGGGLAAEATTVTDPFFGGVGQSRPYQGNESVKNIPFAGPVLGRFTTTGGNYEQEKYSKDFYDGLQKAQEQKATFDALMKKDPSKAFQYQRQAGDLQFKLGLGQAINKRISELSGLQAQVMNNKQMTQEQKEQYLQKIYDTRIQLLKSGVNMWRPGPSNDLSNARGTGNAQRN